MTLRRQSTFVRYHTSNPMTRNSFLIWVVCIQLPHNTLFDVIILYQHACALTISIYSRVYFWGVLMVIQLCASFWHAVMSYIKRHLMMKSMEELDMMEVNSFCTMVSQKVHSLFPHRSPRNFSPRIKYNHIKTWCSMGNLNSGLKSIG